MRPFRLDLVAEGRRAQRLDQNFDASLEQVIAPAVQVVDPQNGFQIGQQIAPGQKFADDLTDQRGAAQSTADQHPEPDVALLDVDLGDGPSGTELMALIVRTHPETAVLMMTQRAALGDKIALPEGVAFLLKSKITDPTALIEAIESTIRGQGEFVRHFASDTGLTGLTRIQLEVLRMLALGYSNARIAEERGITRSGAEQAVSSVLRALGIADSDSVVPRVEAVRRYIEARGVPRQS